MYLKDVGIYSQAQRKQWHKTGEFMFVNIACTTSITESNTSLCSN